MKKKITMLVLLAAGIFSAANAQNTGDGKLSRRERFDRGLAFDTKTPSMPKGMWVAGISGGWSSHDNSDYDILILNGINSRGHSFHVGPMVHYVFANNQSIGVRFQYRNNRFDLDGVGFNITPELNTMLFGEDGLHYRYNNSTYMGFVSYRYYVGVGGSKRLLIFNEVQAGFGTGRQREDAGLTDAGGYNRSVYQKSVHFRLGFAPGATFFVTNAMAIELQIGLLGYEYKNLTQKKYTAATTPDEIGALPASGSRKTNEISAKFDFLSIAFGTTFYL